MEENKPAPAKKGYGKRTKRQWIVIYVIVAVVVYAAIYFLFMHKSGSSTGSGY